MFIINGLERVSWIHQNFQLNILNSCLTVMLLFVFHGRTGSTLLFYWSYLKVIPIQWVHSWLVIRVCGIWLGVGWAQSLCLPSVLMVFLESIRAETGRHSLSGGAWWRSWRLAPKWGKSQIAWCCIESYHKVWWMSTMMAVLRLRKPPPLLRQCARVLLEKLLHWRLKFGESFVREVYSVVRFLSTVVLYKVTYVNLSMFGLERLPRYI